MSLLTSCIKYNLFPLVSLAVTYLASPLFVSAHLSVNNEVVMKEKIAQMIILGFDGFYLEPGSPIDTAIQNRQIGGVVLFDYDQRKQAYERNIKDPQQVKKLIQDLQTSAQAADSKRANNLDSALPLLVSVDYEGGKVNRLSENYGYPKTVSAKQFAQMPLNEQTAMANTMAATLNDAGFNLNFAPVVDLEYPGGFIAGKERCFSSDPAQVTKDAGLMARTYSKAGIASSLKHFPGHGSATGDTHMGFVDVTDTWQPKELEPYQALLQDPSIHPVIMTAHVVNRQLDPSDLPATLSHTILQGLLRDKMGYNGVIITDDMQMGAIAKMYSQRDALTLAINAGADMMIIANQQPDEWESPETIIDLIYQQVQAGAIPAERIQQSYERIMKLKQWIRDTQPH